MPRMLIGERPMTDAERQARSRAARAAGVTPVRIMHRPRDHRRVMNNRSNGVPGASRGCR